MISTDLRPSAAKTERPSVEGEIDRPIGEQREDALELREIDGLILLLACG